jgi:O-antigen/teichoic acid export membrane protein
MSEIVNSSLKMAAKGTVLVFGGILANSCILLLSRILIARNITKEDLGIYSLVVAIAGIVSLIASLGIHEGIPRFVSIYLGEGKKNDIDCISRSSMQIGIISGIISFVILYSFSELIADYIFYMPNLRTPLKIISFYIPFSIMSVLISAILRGHGIIRAKIYCLDIGQPVLFLALTGFIFFLNLPFINIIYAYLFSMIVTFIALGGYGYKKIMITPLSFIGGSAKKLLKFSLPILGVSMLGLVLTWTDTLMLGRYTNAGDVGTYNVSITLARLLTFPLSALSFVFLPIAGGMYARNHISELNRTNLVLTKWIFSAAFPLFFVLFFFPEMTITFLFGNRFIESAMPLRILSLGFLFHTLLGTNGILMMVLNMSRELLKISVIGAVLHIMLCYTLLKPLGYGIIGAAVATVISYSVLDIIASVMLYKKSNIHPSISRYIKPIIGSTVIGIIIYAVAKSLPLHIWMLPLYFIVFVIGYLFSLLITGSIDKEDIFMLDVISEKAGIKMELIKKIIHNFAHNQ